MQGKDYLGYSRSKTGQVLHNSETQCRSLGPACSSMKCLKYKKRHCNTITHEERLSIFKKIWTDMSWEQKQIYVASLMEKRETGRKYVKLHNREIELPTDYVKVTREARLKPEPYEVKYMNHTDLMILETKWYIIVSDQEKKAHDPTVTNLREIHYQSEGKIQIKLQFQDELTDLPQRILKKPCMIYHQRLYTDRLKISNKKYDHLQDLKSTLADEVHSFYENLPYE
ncbi:unnamed protein product [Acanthoscelides obtectus]|uniref:Uncharacterized protein n=1 Tax=Acanthoscelides obtectus TaxID=200917 RepID=A0A9P0LLF3_ACAOB|nr:unnamed protein product [Acanthoscelides obtectus]CAK1634977.1 hypothetical protein AOBTE_LOCUS8983 [Acanthoscelides obtectus]